MGIESHKMETTAYFILSEALPTESFGQSGSFPKKESLRPHSSCHFSNSLSGDILEKHCLCFQSSRVETSRTDVEKSLLSDGSQEKHATCTIQGKTCMLISKISLLSLEENNQKQSILIAKMCFWLMRKSSIIFAPYLGKSYIIHLPGPSSTHAHSISGYRTVSLWLDLLYLSYKITP